MAAARQSSCACFIQIPLRPPPTPPVPAKPLSVGDFTLEAAYEGSWGGYLRFAIDADVSEQVALAMGLAKTDLFNLTVSDG